MNKEKAKAWLKQYGVYFFAPFALALLVLAGLYLYYGPKLFMAFLYAGM